MNNIDQHNQDHVFWKAVEGRDGAFDGVLYYGVRSTDIYCRPTCPSRRPNRENVVFFLDVHSAQRKGFRACKRCKPDDFQKSGDDVDLVKRAIGLMAKGERAVAQAVGVSERHMREIFSRTLGVSPHEIVQAIRFHHLKEGLLKGENVTNAMIDAGFSSPSRLYESAKVKMGMSPASYAKGGHGASIRYAMAQCDLGIVLMAATDHGVAALRLGDDPEVLEGELRREFHAAQMIEDDGALDAWLGAVITYCNGGGDLPRLPLDVIATAFQAKVWKALIAIPKGMTASYGEIAKAIGQPKSARAVGRACGSNGIALLVPCHRVVREGGNVNGYRWGVARKISLLDMEKSGKKVS